MACYAFCSKFCTRKVRQIIAGAAASHGALIIGTVIGWGGAAFKTLVEEIDDISYNQLWTMAILGAIISLIPAGYLADRFGRRITLLLFCFPVLIGWICIISSSFPGLIYFGRFLTGFSCGGFSVVVPLYIAEISEDKLRGMLGCMFHQQMLGGSLLGIISGHESWRMMTGKALPIPIFLFILMYFMPESPVYLLRIGQTSEALKSLKWLRATKETETVDIEFKELQQALGTDDRTSVFRTRTIFTSPIIKPIGICMCFMFFNVLSGAGVFTLYTMAFTTPVLNITNNSSNFLYGIRLMYLTQGNGIQLSSTVLGIILTIIPLIAIGISSALITKIKRKPILIISSIFMSISLILLGIFSYMQSIHSDISESNLYWLQFTVFLFLFVANSFGLGPIPWLMMGELLPTHTRGIGSILIAGTYWITSFIFTYFISIFIYSIGIYFCFWFFAVICATAAICTYFSVPETSGKSFSEIQEYYNSRRIVSIPM